MTESILTRLSLEIQYKAGLDKEGKDVFKKISCRAALPWTDKSLWQSFFILNWNFQDSRSFFINPCGFEGNKISIFGSKNIFS